MRKRKITKGVKEKGSNLSRIRVDADELEHINQLRRLWNEAIDSGLNPTEVKHGWIKNEGSSLFMKNHKYKEPEVQEMLRIKEQIVEDIKEFSPKFPKLVRSKNKDSYCMVLSPADLHIGKLATAYETGKEYNSEIAIKRAKEGVEGLLEKASGWNIEKIIFIAGNDILHTDTPRRTTTSGTPQDTDGMFYDNFLMAKDLYTDVLQTLIGYADVEFVYNPSNHDYVNGFFLAQLIEVYFMNCKNISFDVSISHRKYSKFGTSIIGSTHGDGAKQIDLGSLMSVEAKEWWGDAEFRYFYTHHVHHKIAKDYINVTVETLRSPSSADSWHHRNGYINQPAMEAFIHSKSKGQVARLTHYY